MLPSGILKNWGDVLSFFSDELKKNKKYAFQTLVNTREILYKNTFYRHLFPYLKEKGILIVEGSKTKPLYRFSRSVESRDLQTFYKEYREKKRKPSWSSEETINVNGSLYRNERITFDSFWSEYPRKKDKRNCIELWNRLSTMEQRDAYCYIEKYKASTPPEYICNPYNYLFKRKWEDNNVINSRKMLEEKREIEPAPVTFTVSYEKSELCKHFDSLTLQRAEAGMYSYEELAAIKYLQDNSFEVKKIVKLDLD